MLQASDYELEKGLKDRRVLILNGKPKLSSPPIRLKLNDQEHQEIYALYHHHTCPQFLNYFLMRSSHYPSHIKMPQ